MGRGRTYLLRAAALLVLIDASGCRRSGEPLGRVVFEGTGTRSTRLQVPPGQEIFFRIEGEAIGGSGGVSDRRGRYVLRLEVHGEDSSVRLQCDPLRLGLSGTSSHDDGDTEFRGDIQECVVRPAPAGTVRLDAALDIPDMTDIGIKTATVTAYGAPARDADAGSARWWEGGEPTNLDKGVAFAIFAALIGLVVGIAWRRAARREAERKRIWATGVPGTAKVINLADGNRVTNDNPQVDLTLEVTTEEAGSFRTKTTVYVRTLAIPRIQPGCTIDVRLDPADHDHLVIDPEIEYVP